jgi:protein-tyrosine phosphatase
VLLHCRLGKSRSVALCAAYLAYCGFSDTPDNALLYIYAKRPIASVHPETWRGVVNWWTKESLTPRLRGE